MLQDKRKDLDGEKQKRILTRLLSEVSAQNPDLYYQSTAQIAMLIRQHIDKNSPLNAEERELIDPLSSRDIEVLLSLH